MAKNFVDEGISVSYQNTGASLIYSGSVVPLGSMIGVALGDIPAGAGGTARITGVWKLPKDTTVALALGDDVFWDAAGKKIVASAGGEAVAAGVVTADAAVSAATVNVKINA